MGTYRLEIPGWRPHLASELKCHHFTAAKRKKADALVIAGVALMGRIPRVALSREEKVIRKRLGLPRTLPGDPQPVKRHVRITIYQDRGGRIDRDAPLKSTLDALTTAGLLVDDSDRWCDWDKPVIARGEKGTIIEITDIED